MGGHAGRVNFGVIRVRPGIATATMRVKYLVARSFPRVVAVVVQRNDGMRDGGFPAGPQLSAVVLCQRKGWKGWQRAKREFKT